MDDVREICCNKDDYVNKFRIYVENVANESIAASGQFKLGLSGGSVITLLEKALSTVTTDWSKWIFFLCDERVVPFEDSQSTYGCYKRAFQKLPIDFEKQFVPIDPNLSAHDAAEEYQNKLEKYFPNARWPVFDLLVLGLGPDGHTCSLFPDHQILNETNRWVLGITDSPKPPPSRVTLTIPVLNNARQCVFPIIGKEKIAILKRIFVDKEQLPANLVRPKNGIVVWFLDEDSSQYRSS